MNMRITDVLVNWLEEVKWGQGLPEVDEDERTSRLLFTMGVTDELSVKGFFDVSEDAGMFKMFMYFMGIEIPSTRMDEVVKWVNMVNVDVGLGHLTAMPDRQLLRYYAAIDVENAEFEPNHIQNIVMQGIWTMSSSLPQFIAICLMGKTAEEALEIEPDD